jgi:phage tail sheath gpL-like
MVGIVIPGFTNADKVPGAVTYTVYGNGQQSIGDAPLLLACMGGMGATGGSATPDSSVVQVLSDNDVDAAFVAGSELSMMLYGALQLEGVAAFGVPTAPPAGTPVAATLTLTITGTWTIGGTLVVRLGGVTIQVNIGPNDTASTAGPLIANAINAVPRLFCTATAALGVVTITVLQKGARGNDYVGAVDISNGPPGLNAALTGGSPLTGGVTPFSGGSGADSVSNVLNILSSQTWDFQAWAHHDNTNAALINTQLSQQAAPLIAHPGFAVFAHGRSASTSITFAQTVLNQQLACVVHHTNSETYPAVLAATVAAIFATTAGDNPNTRYTHTVVPGAAVQSQPADIPSRSQLNALLNGGVTPLTTKGTVVQIVDAVCSHSLNGSSLDQRTYHVGDVFTPIRVQKELAALWDETSAANPYAGPDPAPGQKPPEPGRITPSRWLAIVNKALLDYQDKNWLQDVEAHPAVAVWDKQAKRIMTAVPEFVATQNIQAGIVGNQTAVS